MNNYLKAKWLRIVKQKGWKGYMANEFRAFALGYTLHKIETELIREPLALAHSTQLAELEKKVELLKTRLDASTRLGGSFLNDIQMLRIILNLVIDEQTEKIILENYPEFKWVLNNRANILKRLKE